jgi:transcription elongation factor Elf1
MSLSIDVKYLRLISSRLRNFKQKDTNLFNFSCNFCGDSQKNKSKARGYVFEKSGGLFYRCHNCGVSTNLGNLIKHTDASLYQEYILERYKAGESGNSNYQKPTFDIPQPKFDKIKKQTTFEYAERVSDLPSGHFCLTYVQKRKIPEKFFDNLYFTTNYEKFIRKLIPDCDKELVPDARLVIPFYDHYNELIAVTGRSLESGSKVLRYVTVRTNESKDKLLFGMDTVDLDQTVKVVEGQIDSLFLNNCVASGDGNLSIAAKSIDCKEKILIYDNEKRNREILKMMQSSIQLGYKVVIWPDYIEAKDINEMVMSGISPDAIEEIISNNTFSGLEAQTRFTFWKRV